MEGDGHCRRSRWDYGVILSQRVGWFFVVTRHSPLRPDKVTSLMGKSGLTPNHMHWRWSCMTRRRQCGGPRTPTKDHVHSKIASTVGINDARYVIITASGVRKNKRLVTSSFAIIDGLSFPIETPALCSNKTTHSPFTTLLVPPQRPPGPPSSTTPGTAQSQGDLQRSPGSASGRHRRCRRQPPAYSTRATAVPLQTG